MKHLALVLWSDEDEGYIMTGCSAFGRTLEEAVREIGDATEAWIAACRVAGDPVPEPIAKARAA